MKSAHFNRALVELVRPFVGTRAPQFLNPATMKSAPGIRRAPTFIARHERRRRVTLTGPALNAGVFGWMNLSSSCLSSAS
jgi:hypothetical protein